VFFWRDIEVSDEVLKDVVAAQSLGFAYFYTKIVGDYR